jgi:hypothetical protein
VINLRRPASGTLGLSKGAQVMKATADLFDEQAGLATVGQLKGLGMTRSALRARLRREWCYVLPRVISQNRVPLDDHQRLLAALLFAGGGAVISSHSAAAWHGVHAAVLDRAVRVAIPAHRAVLSRGFVMIRRTQRPDAASWLRGSLVVSSPARAVADSAREAGPDRGRAVVIEAVQKRIVSIPALRHELCAGPRAGSAALAAALAEAERGAWSIPEADLARLVAQSPVLPPMWSNPVLTAGDIRLPTPDGWFDDTGLAVQVHSKRYHAGELDWEATVAADAVFAEHGIPVVAVTPRQIATDGSGVVRRIERAHQAARVRPRPAVTAQQALVSS